MRHPGIAPAVLAACLLAASAARAQVPPPAGEAAPPPSSPVLTQPPPPAQQSPTPLPTQPLPTQPLPTQPGFMPFVIKDIRVEGLQRTEPGTVFSYLPIKVGETMTEERAQQSLKALFATGFFQDIRL